MTRCRAKSLALSLAVTCISLLSPAHVHGDNAAFDLIGPVIGAHVRRGGESLPIAEVPNLQAGDRLWLHPDLPDSQSVHYLMVVVFLRGATNPPPDSWFIRAETWNKHVQEEGVFVTVPKEAEQALVFLAPETGGGFSTLRAAVRGKPGAFVRAAQDLEQASLDRSRLEKYLEAVRESPAGDPEQLKARTTLLARSLNIKLEQQCFDKPSAQQVPCLTQNTDQLVLDDAHSQSMAATLTSGAPTDLLAQISSTPTARSGYYSPYIGAVVDVARILSTAHTAQYQYIPALALPRKDELDLRLNNPPSFRNPKSVLVIALPPVHAPVLPPLRAVVPSQVFCADQPDLVLPVEGAPLVFSTQLAHNLALHVETRSGPIDLPAMADPARGGFLVRTQAMPVHLDGEANGVLRGHWGFSSFDGPSFHLRASANGSWTVASKDASALIIGRQDTLHLQSPDACCVEKVILKDEGGKILKPEWTSPKPNELEVKVPLQNAAPGTMKMAINKFALREPDEIVLHAYAEAGRLDGFTIHAGDLAGVLKGTRLDQVTGVQIAGVKFTPEGLSRANQRDELKLAAVDAEAAARLKPGEALAVRVSLKDGRTLDLASSVEAPRPRLGLLSKSVQLDNTVPAPTIHLGNPDVLPQGGLLHFFLKAQVPETFPPGEGIEVATADESFRVLLTVKDGNLTLQDSKTVFAVLDPVKLLGPSAFGPLRFRPVAADGVPGDWQPLVNLVRLPELKAVHCASARDSSSESAAASSRQCSLSGEKLFLIDAVSIDPDFTNPVTVPDGFVEPALAIPFPKGKTLYLKLRDDPASVDTAVIPLLQSNP